MPCNLRILYVKLKSALVLLVVFTFLILLINVVTHRPSILRRISYRYSQGKRYQKRYPGQYLKDYTVANESFCKFNYNLPGELVYDEHDLKSTVEQSKRSLYKVLYNIIEAKSDNSSTTPLVTYCTHITPEFQRYIAEVLRFWDGFVSLAAFVPDFDANTVTRTLLTLCQCLPDMSRMSVHLVFPTTKPPFVEATQKQQNSCELEDVSSTSTFRHQNKLAYPVNVCRNVARNAAMTKHVLVADVELMPSENLAADFLKTLRRMRQNARFESIPSKVYVLPVFEVDTYEDIPRTKEDITALAREEKAVYFHRYICSHCQRFPGLEKWFLTQGDIKPLMVVKREYPYHRWEPIFIGTNEDPFYNEALSWEGKQDKMTQMLEMCLLGYSFVILDGAFLVHWPGIKRMTYDMKLKNQWRSPFLAKNSRQYSSIVHNLAHRYKRNPKCKLQ